MKYLIIFLQISSLLLTPGGCSDGPGQRARFDREIGLASDSGVEIVVRDGNALVDSMENGRLDLWFSAPVQELSFEVDDTAVLEWELTARNATADSVLTVTGDATALVLPSGVATEKRWRLQLAPNSAATMRIAPPDADTVGPFRIAHLSDIQEGMEKIQDFFTRINTDPSIRFVVSAGDITDNGGAVEYDRFRRELTTLRVPFYSTCGNHDVSIGDMIWHLHLGRHSLHFAFKGAAFTLADSANSTIDPFVYAWLDAWLAAARDRWHLFVTHIPPVDPTGVRNGSFSSRREAAKLIAKLIDGAVDLAIYGHIHTHIAYENGGIESHISGGGGGWPMRWDGLDRHFLTIDIDPAAQTHEVRVVKIH